MLIVILWAVFEGRGSTDVALAKVIVFGMFFMMFGYAGVLNTFAPVVCLIRVLVSARLNTNMPH